MSPPQSYSAEVWNYKIANVEGMKKSIRLFIWEKAFDNVSINVKVGHLNDILLNIYCN